MVLNRNHIYMRWAKPLGESRFLSQSQYPTFPKRGCLLYPRTTGPPTGSRISDKNIVPKPAVMKLHRTLGGKTVLRIVPKKQF